MIHTSDFFDNFGQLLLKYPDAKIIDAFSKGQINSKRWLVNTLQELDIDLGTVFICGGWYALLATFLFEAKIDLKNIRSFDIDDSCAPIADTMNRTWVMDSWKFKASTFDITNFKYPLTYSTKRHDGTEVSLTELPNTIINTSCEHIHNFNDWYNKIPPGMLLVLQSNNYFEIPEHINCSKNLNDFSKSTPMSTVFYHGTLELEKYTRFMKIGLK
jgi:hypothetical protein